MRGQEEGLSWRKRSKADTASVVDAGRGPAWGGCGADSCRRPVPSGVLRLGQDKSCAGHRDPSGIVPAAAFSVNVWDARRRESWRPRPVHLGLRRRRTISAKLGAGLESTCLQLTHGPGGAAGPAAGGGGECSREQAGGREQDSLSRSPESSHQPCLKKKKKKAKRQGRTPCRWYWSGEGGGKESPTQ